MILFDASSTVLPYWGQRHIWTKRWNYCSHTQPVQCFNFQLLNNQSSKLIVNIKREKKKIDWDFHCQNWLKETVPNLLTTTVFHIILRLILMDWCHVSWNGMVKVHKTTNISLCIFVVVKLRSYIEREAYLRICTFRSFQLYTFNWICLTKKKE